ncbi:surface-anchored protein [Actinoalloteichus hoggarensis]|uniref:Uncharacterized protein n=1 Tax=Actinoalloteichus hoggarensis TaxID=1470176 RepID=A0A221W741_9PSEU|nr:choice-of-anchor M domain-containing protein [Actinoalloteichus hoggarensis]ASO21521.1 hypothetical protein AHOG_19495 [Actinoalloteichus hoggarensis]MBB5922110.1 surface-anchored protein [Actinoalloteichus hoggarensis]
MSVSAQRWRVRAGISGAAVTALIVALMPHGETAQAQDTRPVSSPVRALDVAVVDLVAGELAVGMRIDGAVATSMPEPITLEADRAHARIPSDLAFLGEVGSDVWLMPAATPESAAMPSVSATTSSSPAEAPERSAPAPTTPSREGGSDPAVREIADLVPHAPRLGWDTTGVDVVDVDGGVHWRLTEADGPGEFIAFAESDEGDQRPLFGTLPDLPAGDVLTPGSRGGVNWGFTAPGRYRLDFEVEVTLSSGARAVDETSYRIDIDSLDSAPGAEPDTSLTPPPSREVAEPADVDGQRSRLPAPTASHEPSDDEDVEPSMTTLSSSVLADGHVDIAARLIDDALDISVKDGTVTGVTEWRSFTDVVLHVRPEAQIVVPDSADFGFLGAPGDPAWVLPQAQQSGILWPGWNTEEIADGALAGPLDFSLIDAKGPGRFALFVNGSFGTPDVLFDSGDGTPDSFTVPLGTHAHGNWAFSEEGVYELTLEYAGRLPSGEQVSDRGVLAVAVGDVEPGNVTPPSSGNEPPATDLTNPPPSPDAGGSPGGGEDHGGRKPLASTGATPFPLVVSGVALLVIGALLYGLVGRRRSSGFEDS